MPTKKTFLDVFLDELDNKQEDLQLSEGTIPISPFIAYAAFKQKVFNYFRNHKLFQRFKQGQELKKKLKGAAEVGAEKIKASVGGTSKGTVYRLTPEQVSVMGEMYNKYGKQLVQSILEFRKNVLAPYQVIKRIIKGSSRVSSKDVTGLSKEEYKASLESGRKKISGRGEGYFGKVEDIRKKLNDYSAQINNIEKLKKEFSESPPIIDYNIVSKIFKHFDIPESPEGYGKDELKKVYDEIMKNYKILLKTSEEEEISPEEFKKAKQTRQRQRELWTGKTIDLVKNNKTEFYKKGSFNVALGKYFFGREIIKQLMAPGVSNIFKKTYLSILDEMSDKVAHLKKEMLDQLISMKKVTKFSEKEGKVWSKLPHIKSFSGNEKDYYQKVGEKDFLDQPIQIHRSPELVDAEQKIENEIKKFEHHLKGIMSSEDFDKLRRYRLIGNLITIKELRSPQSLFKSRAELLRTTGRRPEGTPEETAKEEPEQATKEQPEEKKEDITIAQIESLGHKIMNTTYKNIDEINHDEAEFKGMIKKFQESEPKSAEKLGEIRDLLDRVNEKLARSKEA